MKAPSPEVPTIESARLRLWLDQPLSKFWRTMSWLGASAIFFGLAGLLGGPTESDVAESVYSTWSIAHGNLSCAYPLAGNHHFNDLTNPFALVAPLYPLVSGGMGALLRIGHTVGFPTQRQLGPNCANAFEGILNWSAKSGAILPTIRLSYIAWPVLMAGVIALVRASGRGRKGWEALALFLVALTPPVVMCLTFYFHPQDLFAMGFVMGGVACSLRKRWFWAGVLLGLAFCSQQFALLVAVPLLVVAPTRSRIRFAVGALLAAAMIDVPLIVATSGRATRLILLGSSRVGLNIQSTGGTVLSKLDLHGALLFVLSRAAPVLVSIAFAIWVSRRLGARMLSPVPLLSLVATSLALRLVFEENLFGYYFMAAAVALVLLDVAGGYLRGPTLAWLALVTLAFNPVHLGFVSNLTSRTVWLFDVIPIILLSLALVSVALDVRRRRVRLYKVVWIVVATLTCESKIWGRNMSIITVPNWLWQVVLVSLAIALAVSPLFKLQSPRAATECELVK